MPQITVSQATFDRLTDLGQRMQTAAAAEAEADQIIGELIDRLQRYQELPAKVARLKAEADACATGAAQAVAGDLANPPAE